ncbi:MAG: sodium/solute symporter [Planctomycetes bacterium]|nr:sodium/solute symporter [Planctomycetota bacterium]
MDGLHWIDGVVVACYAIGMLALGAYYSYRQKNSDEYFVGDRAMNPLLIGVSIFVTVFSTISFLSTPGEIIRHGPVTLTSALTIPIVYFIVGYLMVPVYMRYQVTSAYELLEARLGVRARVLGAMLFMLLRITWMATLIFFAAKAMMTMLGLESDWLPVVTFVMGGIAICYSSVGGLRAVVITDLIQFILLFGGAALVVAVVSYRLGGFEWFPVRWASSSGEHGWIGIPLMTINWNPSWDTQPLFGLPTERVTVFTSLLHGIAWWVCTAGSDQTTIQRFMATGDTRGARRSFLINSLAGVAVTMLLALVGFSLLAYYQDDPDRLLGSTIADDADLLFPLFISHHLPIGLSGLVVSGMFAAAMSSVDSGVNSITAVVMTDFVERFRTKKLSEKLRTRLSRLMALGIGLFVVTASSFLQHVPGNFLEISQRTLGLFVSPLFALFLVGLFVRGGNERGALVAALVAFVTAGGVSYWEQLTGYSAISFQWILPASLATAAIAGWLFSTGRKAMN